LKRGKPTLSMVLVLLLALTGCWDQDYLKDAKMVFGLSYDLNEDGTLFNTVVIREVKGGGEEQMQLINEIFSTSAHTPREARDILDRQIAGKFKSFKIRMVLFSEALAKKGIHPFLNVFYRDPKNALNAHLAVVQGQASDLLMLRQVETTPISEYLDKLIISEQRKTTIPEMNILTTWSPMLDPGTDFVLPYLRKLDDKAELAGVALFHGDKLTGTLNPDEATLFQALKGEVGETARFTFRSDSGSRLKMADFVTIDISKTKRKMKVITNSKGKIRVEISAKYTAGVAEYARNHLDDKKTTERLARIVSAELTKKAKQVLQKLQKARCDGFGIGRELMAFHPDVWKKLNWERDYQKVEFVPDIQVEIANHGIIN
jgi:Ger(x)C family germination protein